MLQLVFYIIIYAIAVEAATEIVVDSKLFLPFHKFIRDLTYPPDAPPPTGIRKLYRFIDDLTTCGYCFSVWVAGILAIIVIGYSSIDFPYTFTGSASKFLFWFIYTMLLHRLSNWIHVAYELLRRGRVKTYEISIRHGGLDTNASESVGSSIDLMSDME